MSADRELLEAAAVAAMVAGQYHDDGFNRGIYTSDEDDVGYYWNPLENNGMALRLAVKLGFTVYVARGVSAVDPHEAGVPWSQFEHGDDPCAATRRAIVRAAAAIGASK